MLKLLPSADAIVSPSFNFSVTKHKTTMPLCGVPFVMSAFIVREFLKSTRVGNANTIFYTHS